MAKLQDRMFNRIIEGDLTDLPSNNVILTLDLTGLSDGDAIPTTNDFAKLIKILKKEDNANGCYLIVGDEYHKIEGYPTWKDNGTTRNCSIVNFNSLSSGEGLVASDEFIFYRFYIDWEEKARVNITTVSP